MEQLTQTLLRLEQTLVTPQTRSSKDELDKLLHDSFFEYGSSGKKYTKEVILDSLPETTVHSDYTISDYAIQSLSEDCVLAHFTTDRVDPDGTKVRSLRTSIWKHEDGGWKMFFHQGTPIVV